ncbi:DnaJ subfamily B member 14 [Intoshia linei]|uniref:DnaJ subfamily B member 14 n=1 Tax=Intoshia linei TaxID=1819745 RepID=A0A177B1Q6_9BILA|nr:DnaJ subfamily B member 14 [Intoshia linei]
MECNRDSAEEFAISAKKSIAKGNLLKAKQLAENANRLFPKQYYKDLITEIDDLLKNGDQLRQRSTVNSNKPSSSASTSKSNDSKKNIENVKSILNENDFYKILKVSKDCSTKDLKVAYRKLALEYHPDKNKTVGASEAFKKIGNAYGVLSTPDKRKQYDLVGPEYDQNNNRQNQHYQYYESAMSPDDVFSAFFGGNFHFNQNGNVRTRHFTFGGNQFRQPNRNNVEQQQMEALCEASVLKEINV